MVVRKNKLLKFLFALILTFVCVINASASTGTITKSEKRYIFQNGSVVETDDINSDNSFYYKSNTSGNSFFCHTGLTTPVPEGQICASSTLNQNESLALAYIINKVTGVEGGIANMSSYSQRYYWTEMSILKYLNRNEKLTLDINTFNTQVQAISSSKENYTTLVNSANSYASKYSKPINVSLSESKLEFELVGDYYYSQKIYIKDNNSNIDSTNISVDNNDFSIEEGNDATGKFFKIKTSKSNISGKSSSVNVTVNASNKYYTAKFYDCATGYQDLVASTTTLNTATGTAKISGSLVVTKLVINKVDSEGNYLSGAKIKIESTDKKYENVVLTKSESVVLENIPYGKYKITEISAPNKYITNNKTINVEFSETKLVEEVKLVNNLTRVEISKVDGKNGKLLEGVKLQVQDKDGNIIEEWESTKEIHVIEGLSYGKYYIVELSAPEGYELQKERIEFEVDDVTEVVSVKVTNNQNVDVPDTFSTTSALLLFIAMLCISTGIIVMLLVKRNRIKV